MFLIDRLPSSPGLRADLFPRQSLGATGDIVRAALTARPPAPAQAAPQMRRPAAQLDLGLSRPARRRKAG